MPKKVAVPTNIKTATKKIHDNVIAWLEKALIENHKQHLFHAQLTDTVTFEFVEPPTRVTSIQSGHRKSVNISPEFSFMVQNRQLDLIDTEHCRINNNGPKQFTVNFGHPVPVQDIAASVFISCKVRDSFVPNIVTSQYGSMISTELKKLRDHLTDGINATKNNPEDTKHNEPPIITLLKQNLASTSQEDLEKALTFLEAKVKKDNLHQLTIETG